MTRYLRAIATLVAVFALLAGVSATASAQTNQQGGTGQKAMVTKTFELTVKGTVPAGDSFAVSYRDTAAGADMTQWILFCGELTEQTPKDACVGDGKVYTASIQVPAGTTLEVNFVRHNKDYTDIESFFKTTETVNADMTNTAWYDYGAAGGTGQNGQTGGSGNNQQGGTGQTGQTGQTPSKMPATGAGGMAALPLGGLYAAIAALVMGLVGLIRR